MFWQILNPAYSLDSLGFIPMFLSEDDPRPARAQFDQNYAHGGGWSPFDGFTFEPSDRSIKYPDDPKMYPIAQSSLHDETILVYPHAWVLILQPNGTFEISRMD